MSILGHAPAARCLRIVRLGLALLGAVGPLATAARAADLDAIRREAPRAGTARLDDLAQQIAVGARPSAARPSEASDAIGALVTRARELDASPELYGRLLEAAGAVQAELDARRRRLEERAGEEEPALLRLFRSEEWGRLDYADAMLGYWRGWALVGRGQSLPAGAQRQAAMHEAAQAFSGASLDLALPEIAARSLLGLAIARRELDDADGARRALERLLEQIEHRGAGQLGDLRAPVRFELAVLALARGDVEEARAHGAALSEGVLDRERSLELVRLEAEAWLARAAAGSGEARTSAAGEAAARLRELSAAGGDFARAAAALVVEHADLLEGHDAGPAGALVAAEAAFDAGRYAQARAGYARALAGSQALPGLELDVVRYKYARSIAESGGSRARALAELEPLVSDRGAATHAPAVRLYYALAAAEAAERPGPEAESRALRAAELLLAADPGAPQADHARARLGRAAGATTQKSVRERMALLEQVAPGSASYPAARAELVRLRAAELARLEARGRAGTRSARAGARALLRDLDTLERLREADRLPADPPAAAAHALLRAKAAWWSGAPPGDVLARIAEAERAGPDADGRRVLLRLRLRLWRETGRWDALARALEDASDTDLRRDFAVWHEAARRLEAQRAPRPPAGLLVAWSGRLARAAPASAREDLALAGARALLAAGRAPEAAERARALVERAPDWGDARVVLARALDATGDAGGAAAAWRAVEAGVEPGTELWLEAGLRGALASRRAGDPDAACRLLIEARAAAPGLGGGAWRARFEEAARGCAGWDAVDEAGG